MVGETQAQASVNRSGSTGVRNLARRHHPPFPPRPATAAALAPWDTRGARTPPTFTEQNDVDVT